MIIPDFSKLHVVVYGDVMLDVYQTVTVERISPEAPIPIAKIEEHGRIDCRLGGAGNVAASCRALGAQVTLIGVVGRPNDDYVALHKLCAEAGITFKPIRVDTTRTTRKTRFVTKDGHQVFRVDEDCEGHPGEGSFTIPECDAIIVSDYIKGAVTSTAMDVIVKSAERTNTRLLVGAKRTRLDVYGGATLIALNDRELTVATGMSCASDHDVKRAAEQAGVDCGGMFRKPPTVLVTRAEKGLFIGGPATGPIYSPAVAREVADVSGAGDTVLAVFACAVAAGAPSWFDVGDLANAAAGIAVSKRGTHAVTIEELRATIDEPLWQVKTSLTQHYEAKVPPAIVGFANGCFDLLHAGHVDFLERCRAQCDYLIVGVNGDESVRRLKGDGRPIVDAPNRAAQLRALRCVDAVLIFEEDTPLGLIQDIKPNLLFKGDDWTSKEIIGAEEIKAWGGQTLIMPKSVFMSTSEIIARIEERR